MNFRDLAKVHTGKPFSDLFPINLDVLARITTSIRANGYDQAHPIQIATGKWNGSGVVCDGHTRLRAAKAAGISEVPVIVKQFESLEEALRYSIAEARDRHNRTDAEIHSARAVLDELGQVGRPKKNLNSNSFPGESSHQTAKILGTSQYKVVESRAVSKHEDLDHAVREGKLTLHSAAEQARARSRDGREQGGVSRTEGFTLEEWRELSDDKRTALLEDGRTAKVPFNPQKTLDIDWAKWSWNPVTGCEHGCRYCYARDIANSIYSMKFKPAFWPARLGAPSCTKVPDQAEADISYRNVFTVSMGDLFGKWVPSEWVEEILGIVRQSPQWNFIFSTKFPQRYAEFSPLPKNAWIGTTVDRQSRVSVAEKAFENVEAKVKWLSVEPMLEPLKFNHLDRFQWLVIGGASSSESTSQWRVPAAWWVPLHYEAMQHGLRIFHKTNLYVREQMFPGATQTQLKQAPKEFF